MQTAQTNRLQPKFQTASKCIAPSQVVTSDEVTLLSVVAFRVAQWLAWWAHNPQVPGSKPGSENYCNKFCRATRRGVFLETKHPLLTALERNGFSQSTCDHDQTHEQSVHMVDNMIHKNALPYVAAHTHAPDVEHTTTVHAYECTVPLARD